MVKLFVGNISATSDQKELKKLFEKYGVVTECDVIRNYAFVHMKNDDEARKACDALNNCVFEGRTLHIEFSTSKLRKAPGMDEVCFRCGDKTHKTNNCPMHDMTKDFRALGSKRPGGLEDSIPPPKRVECYFTPSREIAQSGLAYEYLTPGTVSLTTTPTSRISLDQDPLLARPLDRNLSAIYDEYLIARERYYYFRDRISAASQNRVVAAPAAIAPTQIRQVAAPPTAFATYTLPTGAAINPPTQLTAAAPTVDYYSQAAAAAAILPARSSPGALRTRQDVYYRRMENGTYEAFTLPAGATPSASYLI